VRLGTQGQTLIDKKVHAIKLKTSNQMLIRLNASDSQNNEEHGHINDRLNVVAAELST
jgi:hypothetical protein